MTWGSARRLGAATCSVLVAGLALGATAPASYADQRHKPTKHLSNATARQVGHRHHVSPVLPVAPVVVHVRHVAKPRNPHAATPAIPTVRPAIPAPKRPHLKIKLNDVLLPGLLGQDATVTSGSTSTSTKHSSVLFGSRLATGTTAVSAPVAAVPETAPAAAVVPSVVVERATRLRPAVTAQALLDLTSVAPATPRRVLAARQLVITRAPVVQASSRSLAVPARATQVISRELPRIGAWPAGPSAMTNTGADLPLSIALGGLLLALAAARGVAGMRHPRSDDDGDLTFAAI
ncbi:MAG: hypothetical protein JWM40_3022 [Frankiales bacterium]|nr:hypothetical protein [Frankiales bacterium]